VKTSQPEHAVSMCALPMKYSALFRRMKKIPLTRAPDRVQDRRLEGIKSFLLSSSPFYA